MAMHDEEIFSDADAVDRPRLSPPLIIFADMLPDVIVGGLIFVDIGAALLAPRRLISRPCPRAFTGAWHFTASFTPACVAARRYAHTWRGTTTIS